MTTTAAVAEPQVARHYRMVFDQPLSGVTRDAIVEIYDVLHNGPRTHPLKLVLIVVDVGGSGIALPGHRMAYQQRKGWKLADGQRVTFHEI